jgi:hypothetical protein
MGVLGYSVTDIKHGLDKVYGTCALSYPTVPPLIKLFIFFQEWFGTVDCSVSAHQLVRGYPSGANLTEF